MIEYQRRDDRPGVDITTSDDTFWVPIAHCTRSQ